MSEPTELSIETSAGVFRVLEWPGDGPAAVFLHGLTAVADVWGPTIGTLTEPRRRCIAIDQRGHGRSPQGDIDYRAGAFAADPEAVVDALELGKVHLVGHSMGARIAMIAAARRPSRYSSVSVVDIGPEQWRQNWESSIDGFSQMPQSFASEESAVAFASRSRALSDDARAIFLARLRPEGEGFAWRADVEALKTIVKLQRSRNYWADWERLGSNALLVRGGVSKELRPHIVAKMKQRNQLVAFHEVAGAPHNIPLAAPDELARVLESHWKNSQPGFR